MLQLKLSETSHTLYVQDGSNSLCRYTQGEAEAKNPRKMTLKVSCWRLSLSKRSQPCRSWESYLWDRFVRDFKGPGLHWTWKPWRKASLWPLHPKEWCQAKAKSPFPRTEDDSLQQRQHINQHTASLQIHHLPLMDAHPRLKRENSTPKLLHYETASLVYSQYNVLVLRTVLACS